MKKAPVLLAISILVCVALSCSLAEKMVPAGPDLERRAELWSDVPRIDGLEPSEMEMPFAIKLFLRTALNNLWRLNKEGEDKTPAQGDWVVFTSDKTPSDIQAFYTNDRMTSFGNWDANKKSTCLEAKDSGVDGVLCAFHKMADGKEIVMAVIAVPDEKAKKTNVFFVRIDKPAGQEASNTSGINPTATPTKRGPITALAGSAPYGIEKRSMPTGLDLDKLLPKTVGPYDRAILEKSEQRGTTADSISIDGNSVYATYRNGAKEIFVELGISTRAEDAQVSLDVAASDSGGIFPSDPNFGSIGTEPSYLKVIDDNGAFFGWTRGGYFITAHAKGGEADLDAFVNAFPY